MVFVVVVVMAGFIRLAGMRVHWLRARRFTACDGVGFRTEWEVGATGLRLFMVEVRVQLLAVVWHGSGIEWVEQAVVQGK